MSGNRVKLTNGDRWTAQQFLDHYFKPAGPSTPAVAVDMPWYMSDGPGRYYHPGMFPIIANTINRRDLAPGRYDLWELAPLKERDPSVKAGITHYLTDPGMDTDFDFHHNNWERLHVELAREAARLIYDPRNQGTSYEMEYRGHGRLDEPGPNRGIGRVYHPFTDSQLKAALGNPGSAPPGLLPSFTAAPPPAIKEHLQYLNQANANQAQAPGAGAVVPPFGPPTNPSPLPSGVAGWIASMAGVDPTNPTQPQQSAVGASAGNPTPQKLLPPWVFFGSP